MKFLCSCLVLVGLLGVPSAVDAQQAFIYRPHFTQRRQYIPPRVPSYADYYMRKYGKLPPYTPVIVAPVEPILPPGYNWSDLYVPGFGYVPDDPIR